MRACKALRQKRSGSGGSGLPRSSVHFVHLVDPDRFATRLRRFIDYCTAPE